MAARLGRVPRRSAAGRGAAERTGLAAASVSEHLKVLRKTGLLVLESRGRFRLYTADPLAVRETAAALSAWLDGATVAGER